jgi:hypothetical protein
MACAPVRDELAETTQVTASKEKSASIPKAMSSTSPLRFRLGWLRADKLRSLATLFMMSVPLTRSGFEERELKVKS